MPDHDADPYKTIEDLLAETQLKHFDLAECLGEYRRLIEDIREDPTDDRVKLARGLTGRQVPRDLRIHPPELAQARGRVEPRIR